MSTLPQFLRKIEQSKGAIADIEARGVNAVAFAMKASVTGLMAEASGGDLRLSGVGKTSPRRGSRIDAGAKIGARYLAAKTGGGLVSFGRYGVSGADAVLFATGPAHLVERDTKIHGLGVRGSGVSLMVLPDGEVRTGPWIGGGSQGKHPFERGVRAVEPQAEAIMHGWIAKDLGRIWGF